MGWCSLVYPMVFPFDMYGLLMQVIGREFSNASRFSLAYGFFNASLWLDFGDSIFVGFLSACFCWGN
jgi:hypothetical protein